MTDVEVEAAVRELVETWFSNTKAPVVQLRDHPAVAVALYGLVTHVHHLAKTYLALRDAGLHGALAPVLRQALECAVTAVWIELGDAAALNAVMHEAGRQERALALAAIETGLRGDPVVNAKAEAPDIGIRSGAGRVFRTRCEELEGGVSLYMVYRMLSMWSHAGAPVVDLYVEEDRSGTSSIGLAFRDGPDVPLESSMLKMLLDMLILAGYAWQKTEKSRPSRTRLKELAKEHGAQLETQWTNAGSVAQEARVRAAAKARSAPKST